MQAEILMRDSCEGQKIQKIIIYCAWPLFSVHWVICLNPARSFSEVNTTKADWVTPRLHSCVGVSPRLFFRKHFTWAASPRAPCACSSHHPRPLWSLKAALASQPVLWLPIHCDNCSSPRLINLSEMNLCLQNFIFASVFGINAFTVQKRTRQNVQTLYLAWKEPKDTARPCYGCKNKRSMGNLAFLSGNSPFGWPCCNLCGTGSHCLWMKRLA